MIPHGATVVDLGAGSGFYTFAAAEALKGSGVVYAVDVQKELLDRVLREAQHAHLTNVQIIWGDIDRAGGVKLADWTANAVIIANVLFQIADKKTLFAQAKRLLKPGGKVLLVDWAVSGGGGPGAKEYVPETTARALAEGAGFKFEKSISAGAQHYGMILRV